MGILKLLGKGCSVISETPFPELVGFVGAVSHLLAIAKAYESECKETEDLGLGEEYAAEFKNTNPADVFMDVMPGDNWSIRNAIRKYKELNDDGRDVFFFEAVAIACGAFYAGMNLLRIGRLYKWGCALERERNHLKNSNAIALDKVNGMMEGVRGVTSYYEHDRSRIESEGDLFNYRNCLGISNDLYYIKGALA